MEVLERLTPLLIYLRDFANRLESALRQLIHWRSALATTIGIALVTGRFNCRPLHQLLIQNKVFMDQ
jgi:hypothetical protein